MVISAHDATDYTVTNPIAMPRTKTNETTQTIINNSGNSFHVSVVRKLRELGWTVMVSPYYSDTFTEKPREIDIIAERRFDVHDLRKWLGTLNVCLFIECKYITNGTVFWFDTKDRVRATQYIMCATGLDDPNRNDTS